MTHECRKNDAPNHYTTLLALIGFERFITRCRYCPVDCHYLSTTAGSCFPLSGWPGSSDDVCGRVYDRVSSFNGERDGKHDQVCRLSRNLYWWSHIHWIVSRLWKVGRWVRLLDFFSTNYQYVFIKCSYFYLKCFIFCFTS